MALAGRPVRLVDGATVIMPDTDANQADFPQPGSQKAGLGFPQCRIVGLICLGSGAVLNAAISACRGKGSDEQSLLRRQIDTLVRGDVLVGDAFFATYFLLCALIERGVDAVFEQHGSRQRTTDFCLGQRLGSVTTCWFYPNQASSQTGCLRRITRRHRPVSRFASFGRGQDTRHDLSVSKANIQGGHQTPVSGSLAC